MYISLCALALAAAQPIERLVAAPPLERFSLMSAIGNAGRVRNVTKDGFVQVSFGRDRDGMAAKDRVASRWEVFEINDQFPDRYSLPSIKRHIAYLEARAELKGIEDKEAAGVDFYEALEYFLEARVEPNGMFDRDKVNRAAAQRDRLPKAYVDAGGSSGGNTPTGSATFSYVGPKNLDIPYNQYFGVAPLSGRVNGIAYDPSNPETIWIATAGGGIWKSTDSGTNWSFKSSGWTYLQTNCVAVSPNNSNLVLAGIGDAHGFPTGTKGIDRSTDGGSSWTTVGNSLFGDQVVTRILFHPDNPDIVIALTEGSNGDIYRSTDGGATWAATNAPAGSWDDIDYCVSSGGSRALWAVGGNSEAGGRIYKSTNQGSTWSAVSEPTTTTQAVMDVACSKSVAGKVWVLCPGDNEMFRTTNSGSSWTDLNLSTDPGFPNAKGTDPDYNWSQDTYDLHVTASQYGGTEYLFCGLITLAVSTDNGNNWTDLGDSYSSSTSYLHNDQHCMEVNPVIGNIVLVGCDGGIFRWQDLPTPLGWGYASLNKEIYSTQFYAMAVHPTSYSTYVMGGTQDNASPASYGDMSNWSNLEGGDGGWAAFHPSSPATHYSSSQNGSVHKYTTSTDTVATDISATWTNSNFMSPLVMANSGSNLLLGVNQRVMKYSGAGTTWSSSSPSFGSDTRTMAVGISNTNRVYAGCDNGDVWRSDDGGLNFTNITSTLTGSSVGAIAPKWASSTEVLVGFDGSSGGLYRCTDTTAATPTWTSCSGSGDTALPASPINAIMRDPYNEGTWYVGTDLGAFMTTNYGVSWANMNPLGIGNVPVNMFAIPPDKTYLYAATFGRGIWRIPIKSVTFDSLTVSSASVYGNKTLTGTITLSDPAPPAAVAKIVDGSSYVTVPSEVTVTKGSTTKTFTITTTQVFGSSVSATVYVTCMGTLRSVTFTVKPYPIVSALAMSPSSLTGGSSSTATATISFGAPYAGTVSFTDNSIYASAPGNATIGVGATSRAVTVSTTHPIVITHATITATYMGTSKTATLTINP